MVEKDFAKTLYKLRYKNIIIQSTGYLLLKAKSYSGILKRQSVRLWNFYTSKAPNVINVQDRQITHKFRESVALSKV